MGYAALFGILAGAMIAYPSEAARAASDALGLWAGAIAPVLGPFMACMLMIVSRLPVRPWARVLLSWLCGSPGGAKLMRAAGVSGRSALRMAAMTGTMSPMFFLGTLSGWLGDPAAARLMLICHLLGALALGLCIPAGKAASGPPPVPMPLAVALKDTALALLTVAGCMMLGSVAARMAACALPALSPDVSAGLQCLLEITAGVKALIARGSPFTVPLACAACSFGGLSLLMQNAAFWQEGGVGMGTLCLLRALHGVLSGTLCFLALQLPGL